MQRTPPVRTFGGIDTYLHALGDPAPSGVLVAVVAISAAVVRRWNGVVLTIVGTGLAIVLTELVLKPLVDRRIGESLAYPSSYLAVNSASPPASEPTAVATSMAMLNTPCPLRC